MLDGKGAVVTDAASGIGKAIATALAEAGPGVLLCDLDVGALDAAARRLGGRASVQAVTLGGVFFGVNTAALIAPTGPVRPVCSGAR